MLLSYLTTFSRIIIGFAFAISFISKVSDVSAFEYTIKSFDLLPKKLHRIAALLFLSGELSITLLLVIGSKFLIVGFGLAIVLLIAFSIAMISVLVRNIRTSCNCFGLTEKAVSIFDVWRNASFFLFTLVGLLALSTSTSQQTSLAPAEFSLLSVIAIMFVTVLINFEDIVQLFKQA